MFLATEVLFFGVLFASYTVSRILHSQAFAAANHHTDVVLGSINTAVLLTSSLTMALTVRAGALGARRATSGWLVLTALLGVAFLVIKGVSVAKILLIMTVFMHLRQENPLVRLAAAAGFFWLLLMFTLTLSDYLTR